MELERLENEIENIGKWHWENWEIHLEIGFVGNWNEKHHGVGYIGKLNWK